MIIKKRTFLQGGGGGDCSVSGSLRRRGALGCLLFGLTFFISVLYIEEFRHATYDDRLLLLANTAQKVKDKDAPSEPIVRHEKAIVTTKASNDHKETEENSRLLLQDVVRPPQQKEAVVPASSLRGGGLPAEDHDSSKSSLTGSDVAIASEKKKKNAYSFQIAPCEPEKSTAAYRHLLYSVFTAIYALKYKHGSHADFHVYVEMIYGSNHTKLPEDEERVLNELGDTYVHYIPAQPDQTFYRTQLQKFRILGLEQYNHVWHLDADILPLSNLDYVFDLMDQGVLKKNVAFAESVQPASGGTFIVSPHPGALKEINDIIHRKERSKFDEVVGWGHEITAPDRFVTVTRGIKTTWDFFAADGDQGLLFYWMKYVEKDVSFVLPKGVIEHWGPSPPGEDDNGRQPVKLLEVTKENALKDLEETLPKSICLPSDQSLNCKEPRPRRDLQHFAGVKKPWTLGLPNDFSSPETSPLKSQVHYWFSVFDEINKKYHLGVNLTTFTALIELDKKTNKFTSFKHPPGYHPKGYRWKQIYQPRALKLNTVTTLIDDSTTT